MDDARLSTSQLALVSHLLQESRPARICELQERLGMTGANADVAVVDLVRRGLARVARRPDGSLVVSACAPERLRALLRSSCSGRPLPPAVLRMLRASLQTGAVGADGPTDRPAQPAALDPLQCRLLTLLADGADDRSRQRRSWGSASEP